MARVKAIHKVSGFPKPWAQWRKATLLFLLKKFITKKKFFLLIINLLSCAEAHGNIATMSIDE